MEHLAGDKAVSDSGYFLDVFRVKRGSVIALFVAGYRNRSDAEKDRGSGRWHMRLALSPRRDAMASAPF
jgi:hypothetical protein